MTEGETGRGFASATEAQADAVTWRLDEIRGRARRATPGPWQIKAGEVGPFVLAMKTPFRIALDPDAEFIAHAREDVPWLLDMLAVSESGRKTAIEFVESFRHLADAERLLRERAESAGTEAKPTPSEKDSGAAAALTRAREALDAKDGELASLRSVLAQTRERYEIAMRAFRDKPLVRSEARPPWRGQVRVGQREGEVQFLTDDMDISGQALAIFPGGNGDWYIGSVYGDEAGIGRFVRVRTHGVAVEGVPAHVANLYRLLHARATEAGSPPTPSENSPARAALSGSREAPPDQVIEIDEDGVVHGPAPIGPIREGASPAKDAGSDAVARDDGVPVFTGTDPARDTPEWDAFAAHYTECFECEPENERLCDIGDSLYHRIPRAATSATPAATREEE